MDFIKSKTFPYIIAISAGAVAFSAAFFSVFGLSKLFAGAQASVVIMAGSLEFAKLVTASFCTGIGIGYLYFLKTIYSSALLFSY